MRLTFDIFIVVDNFICSFLFAKADNYTVHCSNTLSLISPAKSAVRKVSFHAMR